MAGDNELSIKNWPEGERPRERLIRHGGNNLSDAHLLGIIIGSGDRASKKNAVDLSRELLSTFGNFQGIDTASINELCAVKGIGAAKAAQIKAALEVGRRMNAQKGGSHPALRTSMDFVNHYGPFLRNLKKEVVKVVLLNPKLKAIKDINISEGSLNASIVHPREVMIPAIKESAASIVLMHNHPSGDPAPSPSDVEITHRVSKTGEIVGIKLVDHIIIGDHRYYSFADQGLL